MRNPPNHILANTTKKSAPINAARRFFSLKHEIVNKPKKRLTGVPITKNSNKNIFIFNLSALVRDNNTDTFCDMQARFKGYNMKVVRRSLAFVLGHYGF